VIAKRGFGHGASMEGSEKPQASWDLAEKIDKRGKGRRKRGKGI
jgi:hypothetical protein